MSLHCDRSLLKGRSTGSSWLPSWWRSRDDSKRGPGPHHPATTNPCECGLIQLRVDREDLQMPVFTTKVAPTCIIGSHHRGDYSFPPRELKLTDLSRSSIIGGQFKDGQFREGQFGDGHFKEDESEGGESSTMLSSFSSYDLSQSSSMTPLLPLEITTNKFRNRKRKEQTQETRANYFDATSEVIDPLTEPLIDLQPSNDISLSSNEESWQEEPAATNQNVSGNGSWDEISSTQLPSTWSQNIPNSLRASAGNFFSRLQPSKSSSSTSTIIDTSSKVGREEMLRMFLLKLEEESNYFDTSPSPDEELCECSKCQSYYGEYYARYLEEYQKYGAQLPGPEDDSVEISILMGDLMNNGVNPTCAIM